MQWLVWFKEVFQLLGAASTCFVMMAKVFQFGLKLYMMVSKENLKLDGKPHQRTDMERAFHERDDEHSLRD